MAKEQDEENIDLNTYIPPNVIESGKLFGIPYRNWLEALICAIIVVMLICAVNFTTMVKIIASIIFGIAVFAFTLRGIKNRSITQFISDEISYRKNKRKLSLRGPEFVRSKKSFSNMEEGEGSIAERKWREFKKRLLEFAKANSEDKDS